MPKQKPPEPVKLARLIAQEVCELLSEFYDFPAPYRFERTFRVGERGFKITIWKTGDALGVNLQPEKQKGKVNE